MNKRTEDSIKDNDNIFILMKKYFLLFILMKIQWKNLIILKMILIYAIICLLYQMK